MAKNKKYALFLGVAVLAVLGVYALSLRIPLQAEPLSKENGLVLEKKAWGVYAGQSPQSFEDFQNLIGQIPDMFAVFSGWNEPFPADKVPQNSIQVLVVFWEQYDVALDEILSGSSDSYIAQFAESARNYGGPVIIAPLHEMNGDWSPWSGAVSGNNSQKTVLAFRHIHDTFSQSGPNPNVKWAWVVNHESVPDIAGNQIEDYYPGDNYVDCAGVDGFNFGDPWQSYSEIFSEALNRLSVYKKPIYIFSMASAEGQEEPAWIKDAIYNIRKDPRVKGFIWFNENKEKNWLINSSPESLQAFQDSLN